MKNANPMTRQFAALSMALLLISGIAQAGEQRIDVQAEYPTKKNDKVFPAYPAYALFASGGVFFLSGIITGSVALKLNSDLKDSCPGSACYEPYHDKVDRMDHLATVTDIFIPLSLVMLGSGAFLYLLSRKTHESYCDGDTSQTAGTSPLKRLSVSGSGVTWRF